jgi:hypothetical protein
VSLIPLPYRLIAIALAVAALSAGLWGFIHHQRTLGKAEEVTAETQRALTASIANQAVTAQRIAAQQENLNEDARFATARAVDAASLDAVARRLHDSAASGRLGSADSATSAASYPGSMPAAPMVRADVYFRALDAAVALAKSVDCARGVSELCTKDYGTLIAPAKAP